MDEDTKTDAPVENSSEETTTPPSESPSTDSTPKEEAVKPVVEASPSPAPAVQGAKQASLAHKINKIMAFVLIFSGIGFVLIAILALWEVFGPNAGEIVWKALGSLGAIALGALIVSVASKLIDERK